MMLKVRLKENFERQFLVTLKGNQFLKDQITEVDTNDKEVQAYLLMYEDFIEIFDDEDKKKNINKEKNKTDNKNEEKDEEKINNKKNKKTKIKKSNKNKIKEKK